jgi:hypothetical protein
VRRAWNTHATGKKRLYSFGCKSARQKILARPRHKWDYFIKIELREMNSGEVKDGAEPHGIMVCVCDTGNSARGC